MIARALVLAFALVAAGCATPETTGVEEPAPVFAVLETLPPAGVVAAGDLFPATPARRVYTVIDEHGVPTGDRLVETRRPRGGDGSDGGDGGDGGAGGDGGDGGDVEIDFGEDLTLYLRVNEDGSVEQYAAAAHDQQALTRFDPPLTLAWAELPAGEKRESRSDMRVVDARDPRRERESGRALRTIEYAGDDRIETPLGALLAQRVEVSFQAKLRLAQVRRAETIWVVPGMGVVARDDREQLRILGLPGKNDRRRLVILE
jgi:hypothetical protein